MCSFVSASMADPLCGSDFFLDTTNIKQEPVAMDAESVGVPIPRRTVTQRPQIMDMSELQDFTFSFDENMLGGAQQMSSVFSGWQLVSDTSYPVGPSLVITRPEAEGDVTRISDSFKMEEDDIFQVDKADLIQGPTLAELNANDDTLLDDLSFDDLLLPDESSCYILPDKMSGAVSVQTAVNQPVMNVNATASKDVTNQNFIASSFPPNGQGFYRESFASSSVPSNSAVESFPKATAMTYTAPSQSTSPMLLQKSTVRSPNVSPLQQKHSTLHELLLKKETLSSPDSQLGQSVPKSAPMAVSPILTSRLSSSAPTHLGFEQLWQRREPRPHLLSTGSLAEAGSTSSLSTGGVLSPESHEFSHDEGFDSEDDSDHYEDMSSDGESSDGECGESKLASALSKRERYFWQYNVQAKGPKGQRLVLKTKLEDPHVLNEVMDPVFSPQCAVRGIKHSGKARKGDGNDLTPNPRKLHSIGKELDKLGRLINEMTPVSELPFNVRPKTRKEKNKLASRACRLKKKAQHEANKLKLYGLEHEHRRLIHAIEQMKQLVAAKCTQENAQNPEEVLKFVEKLMKGATKVRIAGHTTDFVNKVLEKVKSGVPDGGITDM